MYIKITASMDWLYHTTQCVQRKCLIHSTAGFWELSLPQTFTHSFVTEAWPLEIHCSLRSASDLLILYFKTGGFKTAIISPDLSTVNPCNTSSESHSLLQDNRNDRVQSFKYCFLMQFFWNGTVVRIIVKIKFNSSPQFLGWYRRILFAEKSLQKLSLHFQILWII